MSVLLKSPSAPPLKAPFPYFGGKSKVGPLVWSRFGTTRNYVEPFLGSAAMLLARPAPFAGTETVNDADGFVSNFWRAVRADPDGTAAHADHPVNENDLHARHSWLNGQRANLTTRLEGDPDWFDVKAAGWWAWGLCSWIGSGWCSGQGPWRVVGAELVRNPGGTAAGGVVRQQPANWRHYQGVHKRALQDQEPGPGIRRKLPDLHSARGVQRNLPHLGDGGRGANRPMGAPALVAWFGELAARLRRVRVCSGDWSRVCGTTPTTKQGLTAVFLDPPYADSAKRDPSLYALDSSSVAHDVRAWAIERGDDPRMRICLAGYQGEHSMPATWSEVAWKAHGGYGSQSTKHANPNARKERLWFSPHCLV